MSATERCKVCKATLTYVPDGPSVHGYLPLYENQRWYCAICRAWRRRPIPAPDLQEREEVDHAE